MDESRRGKWLAMLASSSSHDRYKAWLFVPEGVNRVLSAALQSGISSRCLSLETGKR